MRRVIWFLGSLKENEEGSTWIYAFCSKEKKLRIRPIPSYLCLGATPEQRVLSSGSWDAASGGVVSDEECQKDSRGYTAVDEQPRWKKNSVSPCTLFQVIAAQMQTESHLVLGVLLQVRLSVGGAGAGKDPCGSTGAKKLTRRHDASDIGRRIPSYESKRSESSRREFFTGVYCFTTSHVTCLLPRAMRQPLSYTFPATRVVGLGWPTIHNLSLAPPSLFVLLFSAPGGFALGTAFTSTFTSGLYSSIAWLSCTVLRPSTLWWLLYANIIIYVLPRSVHQPSSYLSTVTTPTPSPSPAYPETLSSQPSSSRAVTEQPEPTYVPSSARLPPTLPNKRVDSHFLHRHTHRALGSPPHPQKLRADSQELYDSDMLRRVVLRSPLNSKSVIRHIYLDSWQNTSPLTVQ
ncbi:hypothetical protein BDQ17DRAFT_1432314 [Cyathus striatus]|nr:hypothetical protein BDQ17DRAFT_1432314 [Cyathus striatus]